MREKEQVLKFLQKTSNKEKCPTNIQLTQFILDKEKNYQLGLHIVQCQKCFQIVKDITDEEKNVFSINNVLKKSKYAAIFIPLLFVSLMQINQNIKNHANIDINNLVYLEYNIDYDNIYSPLKIITASNKLNLKDIKYIQDYNLELEEYNDLITF